jgi:hypothetical protein
MKKKHIHVPMNELQKQIREAIALQGFAIRHVLATEQEPAFSYTVGLHTPGTQKPEILISGLQMATRVAWLLDIGFQIQGPPPLQTRQRMAHLQGVPLDALGFPSGGTIFQPGKRYLLGANGLPTCFAELAPEHYDTHLGQAQVFYRADRFPCLQFIWTDTQGIFPWEASFEERFRDKQRLLFDLPRFLSLAKAQE